MAESVKIGDLSFVIDDETISPENYDPATVAKVKNELMTIATLPEFQRMLTGTVQDLPVNIGIVATAIDRIRASSLFAAASLMKYRSLSAIKFFTISM